MKPERVILGLVIVALGLIWLLVNLGILTAPVVRDIWRFWPVLLIIWGLLLLFGRGSGGLSGCLVAVIIILLIAAFFRTALFYGTAGDDYYYEIGHNYAAERVRLDVRQHAGKFLLTANSGTEIAKLELRSAARPLVSHDVSGDSLEISVAEKARRLFVGNGSDWKLYLQKNLPVELTLRSGAADALFDLTDLLAKRLNIEAGAGDLTIRLGRVDGIINIKGGVGNITVYVPENTGIRLQAEGALISIESEDGKMTGIGERRYESSDLAAKDEIIELNVEAAVCSIKLRQN